MGHQQHTVEAQRVEQRQHVGRDVVLGPFVRSGPGPAVAGQVRRDDPQAGRRVGQQVAVLPVVLRPAVQGENGAAVGRTRLGHVKAHPVGLHEGPAHPVDRRWISSHESDYRERLARYRAGMAGYRELFDASISDPTAFWADAARAVTWTREPKQILDDSNPPFYRWFPDGELNTCANALDRHVEGGRGDQPALIYDSPVTGSQRTYTYRELLDQTARFAGALRGLGVDKGDRVVIYMPMIPEAVIAMLACARLGAVHSVVFGGFAAQRTGRPHRRCPARRHRHRVLRRRADPHRRLQADDRRRPRHRRIRPARLRHRAARPAAVRAAGRPRPRLERR